MFSWNNASPGDLRRLRLISTLMKRHPHLIDRMFDPREAALRAPVDELVSGLSSGERVLVRLAVDFWNLKGRVMVNDLNALDSENFRNAIDAIVMRRKL